MLFHNVINSNKSRLASSVIQQQITHHMPNTITSKVRNISAQLQLDCTVETLKNTKKSSFKKLIKKKLTEKIQRRLSEESTSHSKLRFIDKEKFGRKAYLEKCHSSIAYQILKIRLNMENVSVISKASTTICFVISAKGKRRRRSMHYYAPRLREIQFIQRD